MLTCNEQLVLEEISRQLRPPPVTEISKLPGLDCLSEGQVRACLFNRGLLELTVDRRVRPWPRPPPNEVIRGNPAG